VEKLLAMGYDPGLKAMQSIGYRHMLQFLKGEWDWEETLFLLARDTRRYAKRQMTWLRKETEAFQLETEDRLLKQKALQRVAEFLAASESANPTEPT
jgi:tRNA dimethylallyltransferase